MRRFALLQGFCLLALSAGLTCGRVALDDPPSGAGGSVGGGGSSGTGGNARDAGGGGGQGQDGQGGNVGEGGDLGGVGGADGCTGIDEKTCLSRSDCRTDYCPSCGPDQFARCAPLNAPKTLCVIPPCLPPAPPATCAQTTSRDACDARSDCHSVLVDKSASCDCPPAPATCACLAFLTCADGDRARCQPPTPVCKSVAPTCGAGYAVSYTANCFEGCVAVKDCDVAPKGPTPPP